MEKSSIENILQELEVALSALHDQQNMKARREAHRIRPDLTSEDLLNPDNFAEIIADPNFMYEDGLAAGILSAKIAVRAKLKDLLLSCS